MQAGTEKPRFRQDLFAESIDEQGAKYVDVMDPDSGSVFRFYEVEFSIACAMDGERDVPGLVRWAQDELGVTPSAHEVQSVIATLGELGYLDLSAEARAAVSDLPARSGLAAAGSTARDTVVDAPALSVPASQRRPIPVEDRSERPPKAAAPGTVSEVSLDLSEHLAVGREDVQEAVRQSRVMAAVEAPPDLLEPATTPAPAAASQAERPAATPAPSSAAERPTVRPSPSSIPPDERPTLQRTPTPAQRPQTPAPVSQSARPVEVKQPERPVEVKQPERPVERPAERPAEHPVQTKQLEAHKQPVALPKAPEKQPVVPPAPARGMGPVIVVILVLVALGIGAFFVWKLVLDKPSPQVNSAGPAPVQPQPQPPQPPPGPPAKAAVTAKIEMTSGRPKTILAYFAGVIEWIETSGKEVKSNDLIVKLQGYKALEAQVATLTKELDKLQADAKAANKDLQALAEGDEAARRKAQTKVEVVERARDNKSDQLVRKTDQLEPYYVRLTLDGTLTTVLRKVGDKIPDNTPVATIVPVPVPSATFKIPPNVKIELGTVMALRSGEKILTCEVADWEPEKIRFACPEDPNAVAGATVSWQLP